MYGVVFDTAMVQIHQPWTDFKSSCRHKKLCIQMVEKDDRYQVFAIDSQITYICEIYRGIVPGRNIEIYSQTQNDMDKFDFELNYKDHTNCRISSANDGRNGAVKSRITPETGTYGRTAFECDTFVASPNQVTKRNYKWPYKVDLVDGRILGGCKTGDKVRFVVAPNTPLHALVGYQDLITQPIEVGDTTIQFNPTFLKSFISSAIIDAGNFELTFAEGAVSNGPYRVSYYKKKTGELTLGVTKFWEGDAEPDDWVGFDNAFSTSVKIYATRVFLDKLTMIEGKGMALGSNSLSSAPLPANVHLQLQYDTTDEAGDRNVEIVYHMMTGKIEIPEEDDD